MSSDILHRLDNFRSSAANGSRQDTPVSNERDRAAKVRHLAKYVFPREFGLATALQHSFSGNSSTAATQDFSDREREIKVNAHPFFTEEVV